MHVLCDRLGEDLVVACHRPLEGPGTTALVAAAAVAGQRCSDHAYLTMPRSERRRVLHCRGHRRLLGRGVEQGHSHCRKDRRFIGNSSPSSLTSTGSRSRADWR